MLDSASINFADLPYFLGACTFLLLAIRLLLLRTDSHTQQANYYLVALFGIFSLLLADEFFSLVISGYSLPKTMDYLMYSSHLLLGPLTYLYISRMLKPNHFNLASMKHFIPFVLLLLLAIVLSNAASVEVSERLLVVVFITSYLSTLPTYVFMSLRKLDQYLGQSLNLFSDLQDHNLNWARFWLFFMLFLALDVVTVPLLRWAGVIEQAPFEIHYLLAIAGLILLVWPNSAKQKALLEQSLPLKESIDKTAKSDDAFEPIFKQVKAVIASQQGYLKNGLTLSDVSSQVGYGVEDISRAINKVGGMCFYDFINDFRIEESKRLLATYRSRSILDIALDAGFSSKSAFYTAFKKRVGITPSVFRKDKCRAQTL